MKAKNDIRLDSLALAFMAALVPASAVASLQGEGTIENPYCISTAEEFLQISDNYAAAYVLTADIDLAATSFEGFGEDFTGVFDGDGHVIKGMKILKRGIFQNLKENGKICDLTLESPSYSPSGWMWSGGVVGSMEGSIDDNFTPVISGVKVVNPKVESDSFQMWWGGITGWATKSVVIENCAVTGADINLPKAMAGGIVGEAPGPADIKNCFFEGSIVGVMVGGICSEFRHGKMSDCYVDAELACTKSCGGLIANLNRYYKELPEVLNCFVSVSIEADLNDLNIGGLVGEMALDADGGGLKGCIVNKLTLNSTASQSEFSHRIAGVNIPEGSASVVGISECYVIDPSEALKSDMAAEADSPEGATMLELSQTGMERLGFRFGSDSDNPWNFNDGAPTLFYFAKNSAVNDVEQTLRMYVGGREVVAENCFIEIYSADGALIAKGCDKVQLASGMNIVRVSNRDNYATAKFIIP